MVLVVVRFMGAFDVQRFGWLLLGGGKNKRRIGCGKCALATGSMLGVFTTLSFVKVLAFIIVGTTFAPVPSVADRRFTAVLGRRKCPTCSDVTR